MPRAFRPRAVSPALALFLGGCLGGTDGPSIPSNAVSRPTAVASAARPAPAPLPRRGSIQRRQVKVQTSPRTRTAIGEDGNQ